MFHRLLQLHVCVVFIVVIIIIVAFVNLKARDVKCILLLLLLI